MNTNFIDLLREPDDVKFYTENSPIRYEEAGTANPTDARVTAEVADGVLRITLLPCSDRVKWIRLRFDGDQHGVLAVLGDCLARALENDLIWKSFVPHEKMAWYFHTNDGECLNSYGVKTGCSSFAFWQCDPCGITLLLDVRNGSSGISPKEPLLAAEVVCRAGKPGENMFRAAGEFCSMMCGKPNLASGPLYGFNNWYWAYGGIDRETAVNEAKSLSRLTEGCAKPYMVIDDGWQLSHSKGYNGGPWYAANERFRDMQATAYDLNAAGCKAGIWIRPLLTMSHVPDGVPYDSPFQKFGTVMDPTHPFTLERVYEDIRRLTEWGYDLIKHDFTTMDLFGVRVSGVGNFHDKTLTNAQIVRRLYETIQKAAGKAVVIGCNTFNHLAAGVHQIQRSGGDTSGRSFEITRRDGIHCMMRVPQNGRFFAVDPDCPAFTPRVSKELNFEFMETVAMTGCALFASVTPGILTAAEEDRMHNIFRLVSTLKPEEHAEIADWTRTSVPSEFIFRGETKRYNWYSEYKGIRNFYTWME